MSFQKRNPPYLNRKGMTIALPRVPNGLPISRRERAADHLQKTHDLAREAVGCIGVFGASRGTAIDITKSLLVPVEVGKPEIQSLGLANFVSDQKGIALNTTVPRLVLSDLKVFQERQQ
jgi:hypothetical protein